MRKLLLINLLFLILINTSCTKKIKEIICISPEYHETLESSALKKQGYNGYVNVTYLEKETTTLKLSFSFNPSDIETKIDYIMEPSDNYNYLKLENNTIKITFNKPCQATLTVVCSNSKVKNKIMIYVSEPSTPLI